MTLVVLVFTFFWNMDATERRDEGESKHGVAAPSEWPLTGFGNFGDTVRHFVFCLALAGS